MTALGVAGWALVVAAAAAVAACFLGVVAFAVAMLRALSVW